MLVANVGVARPRHQVVADVIEHRCEREQQTVDREIPAVIQDLRHLPWHRATGCRFAGGDRVHLSQDPRMSPWLPSANDIADRSTELERHGSPRLESTSLGAPGAGAFGPEPQFSIPAAKLLYHARFRGANAKKARLTGRNLLPRFFETFV